MEQSLLTYGNSSCQEVGVGAIGDGDTIRKALGVVIGNVLDIEHNHAGQDCLGSTGKTNLEGCNGIKTNLLAGAGHCVMVLSNALRLLEDTQARLPSHIHSSHKQHNHQWQQG